MTIHRVKVTFKDEAGEGTGVARSFYTAIGEAFLAVEKLPSLFTSKSKPLSEFSLFTYLQEEAEVWQEAFILVVIPQKIALVPVSSQSS